MKDAMTHVIYLATRRHCAYQQWYTHHQLKTATLGDERFTALGDSSKIVSFYVNSSAKLFSLIL